MDTSFASLAWMDAVLVATSNVHLAEKLSVAAIIILFSCLKLKSMQVEKAFNK